MWKYFLFISGVSSFINPKIVAKPSPTSDYSPLLLTPYIENNDTETARILALVTGLTPNITSYSGFFTIDKKCDSNIFFWFFPSQNNWKKDPVSVWLNGGPGSSSLIGLFLENGPYTLTSNGTLILNEYSWTRNSSMIYIDNPVGTGFSYSTLECYLTTQEKIGQGILNALLQFFKLFPELSQNSFYLTGESYAGKYIPATAHAIFTSDQKINFNFEGIAIGNGWIDPVNQLGLGHYLYQLGLIDHHVLMEINSVEENITRQVGQENYEFACDLMTDLLYMVKSICGFDSLYNFLDENAEEEGDIASFVDSDEVSSFKKNRFQIAIKWPLFRNLQSKRMCEWASCSKVFIIFFLLNSRVSLELKYKSPYQPPVSQYYSINLQVRNAIHVGNATYDYDGTWAQYHLAYDDMKSVKPWFEEILENGYKVLLYSGQLDIIVAYPLTLNFIKVNNYIITYLM